MNKNRRKDLERAIELLEEIKSIIETSRDDEQECFDNMPESLQYSERGEKMESAISEMEDALGYIEDAIENINTAIE